MSFIDKKEIYNYRRSLLDGWMAIEAKLIVSWRASLSPNIGI